jgi:hypothetical protein
MTPVVALIPNAPFEVLLSANDTAPRAASSGAATVMPTAAPGRALSFTASAVASVSASVPSGCAIGGGGLDEPLPLPPPHAVRTRAASIEAKVRA